MGREWKEILPYFNKILMAVERIKIQLKAMSKYKQDKKVLKQKYERGTEEYDAIKWALRESMKERIEYETSRIDVQEVLIRE